MKSNCPYIRSTIFVLGIALIALTANSAFAQATNPWDLLGIAQQELNPSQTAFVGVGQQTKVFVSNAATDRMARWKIVNDKKQGLKISKMANPDLPDLVPFLSSDAKDPNTEVYVVSYENNEDATLGAVPEIRVVAFRKSGGVAQTRIFQQGNAYTYQALPFQKKPSFFKKALDKTKEGAVKAKEKAEKIRKP